VKALLKSTKGIADERCQADKMRGPKRKREFTTMQVTKQLSTGQSWLPDWTREVSAKVKPYGSGRLCSSKNVIGQFTGLAYLSLRGTRFLAYTRNRLRNLAGEPKRLPRPDKSGLAMTGGLGDSPPNPNRGKMAVMSRTTISAHGTFSARRVTVGHGR